MTFFNLFIKGFIIGVGKIIPGVSGAVIAISLGLYDISIYYVNNFFKDLKESIKFLLPISLGIILSIITFSKIIIYFLNNFYLPTILLFIGLIIGGFNRTLINITFNKKNIVYTLISYIFIITLSLIKTNNIVNSSSFLVFFIIGFIDAATMVIPGVSGTVVLMLLGLYDLLINLISDLTNISMIIININKLIPYILGLGISVIIFVKIINYLFNSHKEKTYSIIVGFSFASLTILFIQTLSNNYSVIEIFVSLILLVLGCFISKKVII